MEFLSDIASLINSTLRISTPLVFAAMAGIFAERSGVIDFSLEGKIAKKKTLTSLGDGDSYNDKLNRNKQPHQ